MVSPRTWSHIAIGCALVLLVGVIVAVGYGLWVSLYRLTHDQGNARKGRNT